MILRFLRAVRIGYAMLALEKADSDGAKFCVHNSWQVPGFWISLSRPPNWTGALGKPSVSNNIEDVLNAARKNVRP